MSDPGATAPRPLGTLLYVPVLLAAGWLLARPLALLAPSWRPDQLDLAGAVISLLLLLLSLPVRLRRSWAEPQPWQRLGLRTGGAGFAAASFTAGLLLAAALLALVAGVLLLGGQARWLGAPAADLMINALALLLGVGFAEELLFRGWLWGELRLQLPARQALLLQAALFALVHPWYRSGGAGGLGLLGGLMLLGLVLALLRRRQRGSLWGAVGLHGGLVGGWLVVQHGLLAISPAAPRWLTGPGLGDVNPIGGVLGWGALLLALALIGRSLPAGATATLRPPDTTRPDTSEPGSH